jgi:hypothetical protein
MKIDHQELILECSSSSNLMMGGYFEILLVLLSSLGSPSKPKRYRGYIGDIRIWSGNWLKWEQGLDAVR